MATPDPNKRGYLYKRAAVGIKKWNKRFFEVSGNNYLVYYIDESRKDPKMIDLSQARAIVPSSIGTTSVVNFINGDTLDTQLCFEIQCPQETHYLNAPNRREYDIWLATLNDVKSRGSVRTSNDISNSHLFSTTNPAFNNVGAFSNNSRPNTPTIPSLHPPINDVSMNPVSQLSPNLPRPPLSFGASVTLVAFEAPVALEFPDLSLSYNMFDCTWEKQLLAAIENEKESRAAQIRDREARLANGTLNHSVTQIQPTPTTETPPPVPSRLNKPPQPTFKDEIFLELVNESFNPDLIKRAFELFQINDKAKLQTVCRIYAGVLSSGTTEDLFLEVYNLLKGDASMVPGFIQSYHKLAEIGFPSYKCKEALLKFNMDHEQSVQWLLENT